MKWPSKMLQNLLYFWNMKTQEVFFVFHFMLLYFFPLLNGLVYVDIDQGVSIREKYKIAAQNEKRKKLCGLSNDKNIANFEAFC